MNWRTEILAGTTTFFTMAYIVFVNPAILSAAGIVDGGRSGKVAVIAGIWFLIALFFSPVVAVVGAGKRV